MANSTQLTEAMSKMKTIVHEYAVKVIKESERSGNTPTQEGLLSGIDLYYTQNLLEQSYSFTSDEFSILHNYINNYSKTSILGTYQSSLKSKKREVNGQFPGVPVTDEWVENSSSKLKEVKTSLYKKMKELMSNSIKTGNTPSRAMVAEYLTTQMNQMIVGLDGLDEQAKVYITNYTIPYIDEVLVQNAYDFSMEMEPRKVNNKYPWTPVTNDETTKPVATKSKIPLSDYQKTNASFSGTDMVCSIDITMPDSTKAVRVIGSLQTITYSIHQDKQPVRAIGNMNAKDYVFGPRTIAGTLIFAVFNKHWAYEIMDEYRKAGDLGSAHFLMDELPPFQITISAANEYGYAARLALYDVRIINEGQVMAVNDVFTENTYQFVATDLDYLTSCTGYKETKSVRAVEVATITSTPLPSAKIIPVASTPEIPVVIPPGVPAEEVDTTDPAKPVEVIIVPTIEEKPYGNMTESESLAKAAEDYAAVIAKIDTKAAAGDYSTKPNDEKIVRKVYLQKYESDVQKIKAYFSAQKEESK